MGLSDIDEDEPVTHSPRPPVALAQRPPPVQAQRAGTANGNVANAGASRNASVLDDLFGNMDVSASASPVGGASTTSAVPFATSSPHTQRPAPAAPSVLDDLFAAPAVVKSASGIEDAKAAGSQAMLYVDGTSGASPDDGTNLFDLSKPVKKDRYNNAESFLEAFERQGRKGGGGGGRTDERETLAHLTRNKDDNKVRARLLALMNYYDVLGVASTASEEEIKRSYKKKALELHPDRVGRDQTQEEAELFKVITKANEVLSDPEQRRKYDESLAAGLGQPASAPSAADWWSHVQHA